MTNKRQFLKIPELPPKVGDLVLLDCPTPYTFVWGEDDSPCVVNGTMPILVRDGVSMITYVTEDWIA